MNTANAINGLPGDYYPGNKPGEFCTAGGFVAMLKAYADKFQLPVWEQTEVIAVGRPAGKKSFTVTVAKHGFIENYQCRQVIICSGSQNKKWVPPFAKDLPADILQLHAGEYKNPSRLPDGAVLVAGSGQSGCQVAEDIAASGKKVYLATSMVPRVPRYYRGKDIMEWLILTKFFDAQASDITDPKMLHMRTPLLTGINGGKRTMSLQGLAKKGITILGKLDNADENFAHFQPNAAAHVKFADEFSAMVKGKINEFIAKNQLSIPEAVQDPDDMPVMNTDCVSSLSSLDWKEHNIGSVIWATGFSADFSYIRLPVLDLAGRPEHKNGVSNIEGLYFLGLPWLRTRKSALIYGIKDDAKFICDKVYEKSQNAGREESAV
jgi:putative flavoprotein involved in K+ transport